jgi:hypothetical protein
MRIGQNFITSVTAAERRQANTPEFARQLPYLDSMWSLLENKLAMNENRGAR